MRDVQCQAAGCATVPLYWFEAGIIAFGLISHQPDFGAWRWLCLLIAGIALCQAWTRMRNPLATTFGVPCGPSQWPPVIGAAVVAVAGAGVYRLAMHLSVFPSSLEWFAATAIVIGMTEEVVWRGAIQGELTKTIGGMRANLFAAAMHTSYKLALFIVPAVQGRGPTLLVLGAGAAMTFLAGVLIGDFRRRYGTIGGPVLAHMLFDLLVYGDRAGSPWWVW